MNKKPFLFIALVLIIVIAAILILVLQKNKQAQTGATNNNQGSAPSLPPGENTTGSSSNNTAASQGATTNEKISVKAKGGEISVNNFETNAEVANNGIIYFADKKEYNISYNSTINEFIVTILVDQNIENTRKEAENVLLNSLGISQQDVCRLQVYLYVSAAIDKDLSDNHGLSFCPGSKIFPN